MSAVTCAAVMPIPVASAQPTKDLKLVVLSSENLADRPYVFVRAALSGELPRSDGSSGTFKVPVWMVYPKAGGRCNGMGVVEPIHSVGLLPAFLNQLSDVDAVDRNRLAWPTLAADASLFGPAHGGYVWAGVFWNKPALNGLKGKTFQGIPIDESFHIDNGFTDQYHLLAAASLVERDPTAFFAGDSGGIRPPCPVRHVISGGYSNSALVLRSMYFLGLNTALANDARFSGGLVFDGSIHGALTGNHCRDEAGALYLCSGPTPTDQGKVITIHPEYDVTCCGPDPDLGVIAGYLVRGEGANWRIYEMAGVSHIATWSRDLKALGIKPAGIADQNYADGRPVFRAMVENLRWWITRGVEPPPNALLEGDVIHRKGESEPASLFVPSSMIGPRFDLDGDYDLNADGGIRLPHVRTVDFGAPLGVYRGMECNNPDPLTEPLACPVDQQTPAPVVFGGSFYPYSMVADELSELGLPNPCANYTSRGDYIRSVVRASRYAASQRWILADEIGPIVTAADEQAKRYPDCVPSS